jgi:hypothetical protein
MINTIGIPTFSAVRSIVPPDINAALAPAANPAAPYLWCWGSLDHASFARPTYDDTPTFDRIEAGDGVSGALNLGYGINI